MSNSENDDLPFSQRNGLSPVPPQLQLGQVSTELRRLLWYAVHTDLETCVRWGPSQRYVDGHWVPILRDVNVRVFKRMPDDFDSSAHEHIMSLRKTFENFQIGSLFDFVEFLLRHPEVPKSLRTEISVAFTEARAAYRVIDLRTIGAVGSEYQAATFLNALSITTSQGLAGARAHLVDAASHLKDGDWPGSIRESIHAVESIVTEFAPDNRTLGSALTQIEKSGHLHGSLKSAFSKLYGYTSDEEGVRHALVLSEKANVDEADALCMLGACASFVTFLAMRIRA